MMMKKRMVLYSITLALLIIGLSGAAFAHWTKTISVYGVVTTGSVDWEWEQVRPTDISDQGPDEYKDPRDISGFPIQGLKNVAEATLVNDEDSLIVTITNAYPMYTVRIHAHAHYLGTVPGLVKAVQLMEMDGTPIATLSAPQDVYFYNDAFLLEWYEFAGGQQLHACQTFELSFDLTALEPLEQDIPDDPDWEYQFKMKFVVINYNEYDALCPQYPFPQ